MEPRPIWTGLFSPRIMQIHPDTEYSLTAVKEVQSGSKWSILYRVLQPLMHPVEPPCGLPVQCQNLAQRFHRDRSDLYHRHNETFLLFIRISIRSIIHNNEYHMDMVRHGIYLSCVLLNLTVIPDTIRCVKPDPIAAYTHCRKSMSQLSKRVTQFPIKTILMKQNILLHHYMILPPEIADLLRHLPETGTIYCN